MAHVHRTWLSAFALAWLALAWASAEPRPMSIVDLINVARISDPQVSPDGTRILYVLSVADWKKNRRVSHVWRIDADGSNAMQMTHGSEGESSPRWSPDGRTIAFVAKRGEDEFDQVYLLPNGGGEARALTRHKSSISRIAWAPGGSALYFTAPEPTTGEEKAREKVKDDVFAFDEEFKQVHLWRASVADGSEMRVTEGDWSVAAYDLSRDGRQIALHRAPSPLYGDGYRGEVWVTDSNGGSAVQITRNEVGESGASLSPDGRQVLFLSASNARFDPYYNDRVFVAPSGGGAARELASDTPWEVTSARWSKDGRAIYAVANMGVHSELVEIDPGTGRVRALSDGSHSIGGWSFGHAADCHVMTLDTPSGPGEVWRMPAPSGKLVQVTRVHESLARDFKIPRQERVEWRGKDGTKVEGLLVYPVDYEPGQRYPLVVQTHGGPMASDKFGFGYASSYVPVLSGKGYAVLKPNYRGSTGYGDRFLRDMVGGYFRNAHLDVMAGVDHVTAMGVADPERLVKMGWSAGGHMTNKIVTFTGRFKAASSGAGAANWISMYGQSDVRDYRTPWFGGTPWQKDAPIDLYWEHSPLKYVANVTTPTLFFVGEKDLRVPLAQSVEMHRALKANGVPTRLYIAPREPHGWSELRHQLFKANAELEWFETHVTKRPYTKEKAPEEPKQSAGSDPAQKSEKQ
jgi:dipeptidyl aminopeptidase/acylaminoacyl peptidase